MAYQLYWGDTHNHNSVGLFHYSKGSLERTIEIAKSHLDFFAFTGHAHWHDMPDMPNDGHLKWQEGFDYHTEQWPTTQRLMAEANQDGEFVAFLGYEWHSAQWGDRSVLYPGDDGELVHASHIGELTDHAKASRALLIPHHIGYRCGLPPGRGVKWDGVDEAVSPIIEIFSEHGGAERDRGPWPYIRHTNGPRTTHNTLQHGLSIGKKLGVICSTDDHFGYPGAYGEGLAAVYAESQTRAAIWDALWARRCYGVTGDRIGLMFDIDGAIMGSTIPAKGRHTINVWVDGWDDVAMVEVLKNNRVAFRYFPEDHADLSDPFAAPVKCRIEFGWGPWTALGIPRTADWRVLASVSDGRIRRHMPCFQSGPLDEERRNRVVEISDTTCRWESYTCRQGSFAETPTNAVVLEIEGDAESTLHLSFDSPMKRDYSFRLGDLMATSAIEFTDRFPCECFIVHRLVPQGMCTAECSFADAASPGDYYYARITQANGHMAWSSPIWAE